MIPVKQRVKHDPASGKFGDCFRTALASILDIEDVGNVPHFFENGETADEAWARIDPWLTDQGFCMVAIPYPGNLTRLEVCQGFGGSNPNVYYLLGGSIRGVNHIVVCCNDEIVCNPAMYPEGLDGPVVEPGVWHVAVLVPLRFTKPLT